MGVSFSFIDNSPRKRTARDIQSLVSNESVVSNTKAFNPWAT